MAEAPRTYGGVVSDAGIVIEGLKSKAAEVDRQILAVRVAVAATLPVLGPGYTPPDDGLAELARRKDQLRSEYQREAQRVEDAARIAQAAIDQCRPGGPQLYGTEGATREERLAAEWGLDQESVTIILELEAALAEKMPDASDEMRAYYLMLILSKFEYDDFFWDNTVGSLGEYFVVPVPGPLGQYIPKALDLPGVFGYLGLDNGEYEHLRFALEKQHILSGANDDPNEAFKEAVKGHGGSEDALRKEWEEHLGKSMSPEDFEEFWMERYQAAHGHVDFVHMAATAAAELDPAEYRLASVTPGDRRALAGWLGDTTHFAGKEPSLGNGDYKADLDAVNLAEMSRNGMSLGDAADQYYRDLNYGRYTRADRFLEQYSLRDVVKAMTPTQAGPLGMTGLNPYSTAEGKRFLKALERRSNEL
ncbi:MAG: hypothetical protein LBJ02_09680 [Bifidobacteriaceae bacterium]|jgi:hypothetical protein|nr:hypothetical protein [Bifidobacteriaceae bacterium]